MKRTITITISFDESTGAVKVTSGAKSAVRKTRSRAKFRRTDAKYTDKRGREWSIYENTEGRKFALRKSKNKTKYRYYLNESK